MEVTQNTCAALNQLGVEPDDETVQLIVDAVRKDQDEDHKFRASLEDDPETLPVEVQKGNKLFWLREKLSDFYSDGLINEDELESIEEPINKILKDMGIREISEDF